MKCVICKHGETQVGTTTVTLERGGLTLVVKAVPAEICDNCGESYVGEEVAARLLELTEKAVNAGVQVDIRFYAAA
ncbi:MAG TPA: type II toxin-antitoxin system MqsA family antitoxin [Ktedonobacterales bacterium]|nr:type II toxin-antitoxin system MqsA family antitoxin [Ktedonobacterales bacterium]